MSQHLLILFITRDNSNLEKHLLEHLYHVKSFNKAISFAEQWQKTKIGLQVPLDPINALGKMPPSDREDTSPEEEEEKIFAFTGQRRKTRPGFRTTISLKTGPGQERNFRPTSGVG